MSSSLVELVWSGLIALTLVGLGVYYSVREAVERHRSDGYRNLPPADRRHFTGQFYRRLAGSILLVAAGVAIFVGQGLLDWRASPRVYAWLWTGVLLGLLGIICLAVADLRAIRRYARRQRARLEADRRAMIERQLAQYRGQTRGHRPYPPSLEVEQN